MPWVLPRLRRAAPSAPAALGPLGGGAAAPHGGYLPNTVAARIRRIYGREATVIYPPVATRRFHSQPCRDEEYYVYVGRLEAHKRVDVAITAAQAAGVPLRVIGDGPLRDRLAETAPANVALLGWLPEEALLAQLAGCRALLFPGEEDFGIVMVEALSASKPVIAFGAGGATEIVQSGVNGVLVAEQSAAAFAQALRDFDPARYSPDICRQTAAKFDESVFAQPIQGLRGREVDSVHTESSKHLNGTSDSRPVSVAVLGVRVDCVTMPQAVQHCSRLLDTAGRSASGDAEPRIRDVRPARR